MARFSWFALLLLAAPVSLAQTGADATAFPVPKRIVPLSAAVTPREYREIIAAIQKEMAKPKVSEELERGPGLGALNEIVVTRAPLGSLGDGMMVSFSHAPACGTGGCPMWLFVRGPQGNRNVIKDGGWGFTVLPSGSPVPDVVFYWQMGAGETDVAKYHYEQDKFNRVVAHPAKCGGEDDRRGACAGRSSDSSVMSITPAEYDSLGREVQAESKSSAASQPHFFDDAHAIDFPLVNDTIARVVGEGSCNPESNCRISIYACRQKYSTPTSLAECEYWPLLTGISGWGVANVSDLTTDPFAARVAFVIARLLSANEVELIRYSVASPVTGLRRGSTLSRDACQVVSLRTTDQKAQFYSAAMMTNPKPCR